MFPEGTDLCAPRGCHSFGYCVMVQRFLEFAQCADTADQKQTFAKQAQLLACLLIALAGPIGQDKKFGQWCLHAEMKG